MVDTKKLKSTQTLKQEPCVKRSVVVRLDVHQDSSKKSHRSNWFQFENTQQKQWEISEKTYRCLM